MSDYNIIVEQTTTVGFKDLQIIDESKTSSGKSKVTFKTRLQESNVKNGNNRIYSDSICESIVKSLSPKAERRSLLMEIDHPMFAGGSQQDLKKRSAIVEINNCGAVISDIKFDNGQVVGLVETLSGFKGPDLANLIIKDHIDIGFSLRALGSVSPRSDGTLMVENPIAPITYDVVSNPSHSNARIMQFIPETDTSLFQEEQQLICEGQDFTLLESDRINVTNNSCVVVREFVDNVIAEQFMSVLNKKIMFSI